MTRADLAQTFLSSTTWATARREPLAGDASNRRYERLYMGSMTAVLMDAPPDKGEDVRPFVSIAEHLTGLGLSAPKILASDTQNGFLLLEDLGDDLFARVLSRHPDMEDTLYTAATDVLLALHRTAPPPLKRYDPDLMTDLAALAFTRYKSGITGVEDPAETQGFRDAFKPLLSDLTQGAEVLIQRDYHAENLLWLPDRAGIARVGLLDFQDAMLGHPAYDLVSVLQDARRDVSNDIERRMLDHYISHTDCPAPAFRAAYAALGVQRNLRILGVFARLSLDMGKSHYVDFIPRVWALLQRDLDHPALAPIADAVREGLPDQTAENLSRLVHT